jgi:hypothetical protein
MGLADLINKNKSVEDLNRLTTEEIQIILQSLKTSVIRGEYVEIFYSAILKLQNQYVSLNDKK